MRVLFAWALGLVLCAGLVFAAEPGAKKPKDKPAVDKPAVDKPAVDKPAADDEAPDDAEGTEGDETPAKNKKPAPRGSAATESEILKKVSYMIGADSVRMYKNQGIDLDLDEYVQGIKDAFAGETKEFSDDEKKELRLAMESIMAERQAEMIKEVSAKFKREGEEFLAKNKNKEGVKTTKSGLQYKVLKSGKGKSPKTTDTVTTHYKGTFVDGTEFDSSYKRNKKAEFPVNQVIPGWTEALQLMRVGDKWQLVVPATLAYGPMGHHDPRSGQQVIPPNATLIFEVELFGINE